MIFNLKYIIIINIKRLRREKMTEIVLIAYLVLSFGYVLYVVFSNREKDFYFSIIVLMSTLVVTFNYLGIL